MNKRIGEPEGTQEGYGVFWKDVDNEPRNTRKTRKEILRDRSFYLNGGITVFETRFPRASPQKSQIQSRPPQTHSFSRSCSKNIYPPSYPPVTPVLLFNLRAFSVTLRESYLQKNTKSTVLLLKVLVYTINS